MFRHLQCRAAASALAIAIVAASGASAGTIPYPNVGTYNPQAYSFTAAGSGELFAYFIDKGNAGYENYLGLFVNGVQTSAGFGLYNQTSQNGDSFDLGHVNAGDSLVFAMQNRSLIDANGNALIAYSDPALNRSYDTYFGSYTGGDNHIYSTSFAGATTPYVPAGVYVAFEDIPFSGTSDYNYRDETFVFTNVPITIGGVPEPATWAFLVTGFGLVGVAARRRSTVIAA